MSSKSGYCGKFNMYGHTSCPKCHEPYRTMIVGKPGLVVCGDCGFEEPATRENSSRHSAADFADELDDDGDPHNADIRGLP